MVVTHPKLIALKEYIHAKIDGTLKGTLIFEKMPNEKWEPKSTIEFYITPCFFFDVKFIPMSFEDYCRNK